jgi:hypothetical protein
MTFHVLRSNRQLPHECAVEVALGRELEVFHAGAWDPQLGVVQKFLQSLVVSREHLGLDKQREPRIEVEVARYGVGARPEPCRHHGVELERSAFL